MHDKSVRYEFNENVITVILTMLHFGTVCVGGGGAHPHCHYYTRSHFTFCKPHTTIVLTLGRKACQYFYLEPTPRYTQAMPPHFSLTAVHYQQHMSHAYTPNQNAATPNKHCRWTVFCHSASMYCTKQPTEYPSSASSTRTRNIQTPGWPHSHFWETCSLCCGMVWIKLVHWLHSSSTKKSSTSLGTSTWTFLLH
jgi:hypothetical protein